MNVQQTIIKGIREQLFVHDYLVVPHFGGFVLKSSPAHFSGPGLILPPSKTISFNAQLKQNDGNLAAWLCDKLNCSTDEALKHLQEFAGYCKSVLQAKRRFTLEHIGFFYLDFENNLCFEAQADSNFLRDSFGLAPLAIAEIDQQIKENLRTTHFEDRKVPEPLQQAQIKQRSFHVRKVFVPLALLFILFSLLALFVSNTIISGQLRASLLGNNSAGAYQAINYPELDLATKSPENPAYVTDVNGIALLNLSGTKKIAVKVLDLSPSNTGEVFEDHHKVLFTNSNAYEIVLGCFGVFDNAKKMAEQLSKQNIKADISERNSQGLYTVSNGHFLSREDALNKLADVKQHFPKAWIKKR